MKVYNNIFEITERMIDQQFYTWRERPESNMRDQNLTAYKWLRYLL